MVKHTTSIPILILVPNVYKANICWQNIGYILKCIRLGKEIIKASRKLCIIGIVVMLDRNTKFVSYFCVTGSTLLNPLITNPLGTSGRISHHTRSSRVLISVSTVRGIYSQWNCLPVRRWYRCIVRTEDHPAVPDQPGQE